MLGEGGDCDNKITILLGQLGALQFNYKWAEWQEAAPGYGGTNWNQYTSPVYTLYTVYTALHAIYMVSYVFIFIAAFISPQQLLWFFY